jgi:hypothetical protein
VTCQRRRIPLTLFFFSVFLTSAAAFPEHFGNPLNTLETSSQHSLHPLPLRNLNFEFAVEQGARLAHIKKWEKHYQMSVDTRSKPLKTSNP